MTGTRWTTPEQLDFLMARRTDFLEANVKKTRSDFHLDVFTDWFKRWPLLASMFPGKAETELDPAELERYQKALSDKKSVHFEFIWALTTTKYIQFLGNQFMVSTLT